MEKSVVNQKLVWVKDSLAREGDQRKGVALTVSQKMDCVKRLVDLGVPYIEGPWVVPEQRGLGAEQEKARQRAVEFYHLAKDLNFGQSKLFAFGATREKNTHVTESQFLLSLLSSGAKNFTIFGKAHPAQVLKVLEAKLQENLMMIYESIQFLKASGAELVFFDAEHFFDGYKDNSAYASFVLKKAQAAGADAIILCDTNGGTLPHETVEIIRRVKSDLTVPFGVHMHNDTGTAVASSLLAVLEGASIVECTVNGYSERCAMPDLCTVVPNLILKMGYDCVGISKRNLKKLKSLSLAVSEHSNLPHDAQSPYVGDSAFYHKAGTHQKNPELQEHVNPELVGNERHLPLTDSAGRKAAVEYLKKNFKIELDRDHPVVKAIMAEIRDSENLGYHLESAPETLKLKVLRILAQTQQLSYHQPFEVHGAEVSISFKNIGGVWRHSSKADVEVMVDGKKEHTVDKSEEGPVAALDHAIRKALEKRFPKITQTELKDFTVRVLANGVGVKGTASKVRVAIESSDKKRRYQTAGISENIIVAACLALLDSMEIKIAEKK